MLGVKQCNHHYRAEVVDDSECHQKQDQCARDALSEQCQYADRKGDIGSHGYAPAACRDAVGIGKIVKQCRDQHAAERGDDGQRGLSWPRQFTDQHLTFDFKPHDEKEHCHEAVIDPVLQAHCICPDADLDDDGRVDQVQIRRGERGVGQQQRQHSTDHEQDAAGGLMMNELFKRCDETIKGRLPWRDEAPVVRGGVVVVVRRVDHVL